MNDQIRATDLIEAASKSADAAELYQLRSQSLPVVFRAGALESVKAVETAGRALRVIEDGRLGFSTTTDLADSTTLVANARQAALFGDEVPLHFPARQPAPEVRCFDPEVEALDAKALIDLGEEIVARVQADDPALHVDISLERKIEEVSLLNTSGLEAHDRRSSLSIVASVTRTREGDILISSDAAQSRRRQDVDGLALAERLVERFKRAETIVGIESQAMPVVFKGMGTLPLLLPLRIGLNGRQVYLGTSPLSERLDEPLFDERFGLVDDGRLDFAPRSAPYDDEGTPTEKKVLIEDGIVRSFLYDLKTSAQAQVRPTGNGYKYSGLLDSGFEIPPETTPSTWIVPPGERRLDEIVGDLDRALLVEDVIGLGQGNIIAGEFSNNVALGFLLHQGEVVGRVKNTMIAGNVYELLADHLLAVSSEPEWIYGLVHTPALVIDGVSVVSQG